MNYDNIDLQAAQYGNIQENIGQIVALDNRAIQGYDERLSQKSWYIVENPAKIGWLNAGDTFVHFTGKSLVLFAYHLANGN